MRTEAIINLALYVVSAVLVFLSNTGLYGGTNAEISADNQTLLTPASFAFSIWGVIYGLQGAVLVYLAIIPGADGIPDTASFPQRMLPGWVITCAAQVLWSVVFVQGTTAAFVASFFIIVTIGAGLTMVVYTAQASTELMTAIIKVPFAIHLAWIIVASSLNLLVAMQSLSKPNGDIAAMAGVALTLILSVSIYTAMVDLSGIAYSAVFTFACIAIYLRETPATGFSINASDSFKLFALAVGMTCAATSLGILGFTLLRRYKEGVV
jgi:translocator protein